MLRLLRAGKPLLPLLVLAAVGVLPAGASAAPAPLFMFRDPQIAEPSVGASANGSGCSPAAEHTVTAVSYRLRFEHGPHDAETLLVDPRTSQIFIITKSFTAGALYAAPNPLRTDDVNVLRKVADV